MIIFLNRLPIPNLKQYCIVSVSFLALVTIYAQKLFHDLINENFAENFDRKTLDENGYVLTIFNAIIDEPWCIWVIINFCYCGLLIFSKIIQGIIFGKLRVSENQHIKDQFWNFIFLKFIFIFGVLNLESLNEVAKWTTWFSIIGFLSIHSQVCKDRFEYLSFSASTPFKNHIKVLLLLVFIQLACTVILLAPLFINISSVSIGLFLFAESFGLFLRTLYVISRYVFHLWDVNNLAQWNNKGTITYYVDFSFEISAVTLDFLHYLHMLIYGNFYLSMASLVICMELKRLFIELKRRIRRHSNYLRVIEKMEKKFPWASQDELIDSDKCPVCWETLDKARKLPCSHIFHQNCLRSWLEQDTSCPTCRKSLQDEKENLPRQGQENTNLNRQNIIDPFLEQIPQNPPTNEATQNQLPQIPQRIVQRNLFHFDGSRYISWLPSFSLQVTNGHDILPAMLRSRQLLTPDRLNDMTNQISQLFSHIPLDILRQDLQQTHSIEITIENILEDRLGGQGQTNNHNRNNNRNSTNNEDIFEYDENTSSEEDGENSNIITENNLQDNESTSIFSNLLNQNTSSQQNTVPLNSETQEMGNENRKSEYTKCTVKPGLSNNANNLIQRKHALIQNSKKRYLERMMLSEENKLSGSRTSKNEKFGDPTETEHLIKRNRTSVNDNNTELE